jgi:deoxyribodipyrimidine photo-lyase
MIFSEPMELPDDLRVRAINASPINPDGDFVLYWMIAARRSGFNYGLERAVAWAQRLKRPLIVLEALRVDYPWASDRFHAFVIQGMADNAAAFSSEPLVYYPYVEPSRAAGRGLLAALSQCACVIVTDEFPCFFLPRMVDAAGERSKVKLEAVDSNGILPLRSSNRTFVTAAHYRRHVQKQLPRQLLTFPTERPAARADLARLSAIPSAILGRWPPASEALLAGDAAALSALPIDHSVPVVAIRGGVAAARAALKSFVTDRLSDYHLGHNHPDDDGTSRLSPYLHFGHLSAHEIFMAVMRHEKWSAAKLAKSATGAREGWWGVGPGAEAYLDQVIVWRELAYNTCARRPADYDSYDALPAWALDTLARHATDPRPITYPIAALERAATHDVLWNAAQRQMQRDGWFHNYLRMLWGKKILEWSPTPAGALKTMVTLMNRWSLDGRNPNSYAGYLWTLGRYDRPWPERPIYGKVRSMSSDRTMSKVRVKRYLAKYAERPTEEAPRQRRLSRSTKPVD